MEASRVALLTLLWVVFCSQQRNFGAEVEMRVRPGENVIIYSDCYESRLNIEWFMNSLDGNPPRPLITPADGTNCAGSSHYSLLWNNCNRTSDLLIKNITESDQGLYYCGIINLQSGNSYGSRSTRLIILEEPSEPSASENGSPGWSCSWQLLVSVSAVCVLLSSLFSAIGVYYLCRKNIKAQFKVSHRVSDGRQTQRRDEGVETEVCYSFLDYQYIKDE